MALCLDPLIYPLSAAEKEEGSGAGEMCSQASQIEV